MTDTGKISPCTVLYLYRNNYNRKWDFFIYGSTHLRLFTVCLYFQVVEVIKFIFENPTGEFPAIKDLMEKDFFRTLDLREMRNVPPRVSYHNKNSRILKTLFKVCCFHIYLKPHTEGYTRRYELGG